MHATPHTTILRTELLALVTVLAASLAEVTDECLHLVQTVYGFYRAAQTERVQTVAK